ncbi:VanZ family protein [Novibacillus thermophilus]|jgi:VanZ family protein|nr:VanZ family protein [Novibacillus thermophilus]
MVVFFYPSGLGSVHRRKPFSSDTTHLRRLPPDGQLAANELATRIKEKKGWDMEMLTNFERKLDEWIEQKKVEGLEIGDKKECRRKGTKPTLMKTLVTGLLTIGRWILRLSPFAYMGVIWHLSSQPSDAVVQLGPYDSVIKESLHLVEFAILYALSILAFLTFGPLSHRRNCIAVVLAIAYGGVDELHQFFVPSRSADIVDVLKDVIGVCVVSFIVYRSYFGNNRRSNVNRILRAVTRTFAPSKQHHSPSGHTFHKR